MIHIFFKRFIAVSVVFFCFLISAFAQWQGNGTQLNPYRISTPQDLALLHESSDELEMYENVFFELTQDIDLTEFLSEGNPGYNNGEKWQPIASQHNQKFSATLNGNGHTISGVQMSHSSSKQGDFAFFRIIGAKAKIENLHILVEYTTQCYSTAGFVVENYGHIENCTVSGTIIGNGQSMCAGFAVLNAGVIARCGVLQGSMVDSQKSVAAGFANQNSGIIAFSYSYADVFCKTIRCRFYCL